MPLAQTWHAIDIAEAMDIIAEYKPKECYEVSRQGRPYYTLPFVRKNVMKPISHLLIEVCFISSRFSDHAIPSIERGIRQKKTFPVHGVLHK
jgi:hypothetical protein